MPPPLPPLAAAMGTGQRQNDGSCPAHAPPPPGKELHWDELPEIAGASPAPQASPAAYFAEGLVQRLRRKLEAAAAARRPDPRPGTSHTQTYSHRVKALGALQSRLRAAVGSANLWECSTAQHETADDAVDAAADLLVRFHAQCGSEFRKNSKFWSVRPARAADSCGTAAPPTTGWDHGSLHLPWSNFTEGTFDELLGAQLGGGTQGGIYEVSSPRAGALASRAASPEDERFVFKVLEPGSGGLAGEGKAAQPDWPRLQEIAQISRRNPHLMRIYTVERYKEEGVEKPVMLMERLLGHNMLKYAAGDTHLERVQRVVDDGGRSAGHPIFDEVTGGDKIRQDFSKVAEQASACSSPLSSQDILGILLKKWLYQALVGLAGLHDAGLLHNDLNPANVMLVEPCRFADDGDDISLHADFPIIDKVIKIVDFDMVVPGDPRGDYGYASEVVCLIDLLGSRLLDVVRSVLPEDAFCEVCTLVQVAEDSVIRVYDDYWVEEAHVLGILDTEPAESADIDPDAPLFQYFISHGDQSTSRRTPRQRIRRGSSYVSRSASLKARRSLQGGDSSPLLRSFFEFRDRIYNREDAYTAADVLQDSWFDTIFENDKDMRRGLCCLSRKKSMIVKDDVPGRPERFFMIEYNAGDTVSEVKHKIWVETHIRPEVQVLCVKDGEVLSIKDGDHWDPVMDLGKALGRRNSGALTDVGIHLTSMLRLRIPPDMDLTSALSDQPE